MYIVLKFAISDKGGIIWCLGVSCSLSFFSDLTPIEKGDKDEKSRVASPESVPIYNPVFFGLPVGKYRELLAHLSTKCSW